MTPCFAIAALALLQPTSFEIGEVDLFGQTGLDEKAIRAVIPFKPGQTLTLPEFQKESGQMNAALTKLLGRPATDVAPVFYDVHQKTMMYVGLPGPTIRAPKLNPRPRGSETLPGTGLALYKAFIDDLGKLTTTRGNFGEDDRKGYALSNDPAMHAVELQMREYALKNEPAIRKVLADSASSDQREAAGMLLGYAQQTPGQLRRLAIAARDIDPTVRNNATRALVVAVSADPRRARDIPTDYFIELLSSGDWMDRNKGGNLIAMITASRDPVLLRKVKQKALASLIEMAEWTNPPHAAPARMILGRIAGIPEDKLLAIATSSDPTPILSALAKQ